MWFHMMSGSSGARVPLGPFLGFGEATTTVMVAATVAATANCNSLLQLGLALSCPNLGMVHEPLASICTSRDLLRNTPGADHSNTERPQI